MTQQALHNAHARLNQLQKQRDEMLHNLDMHEPSERAKLIFAVINLARWCAMMTGQLPDRRFWARHLEPCQWCLLLLVR